MRNLVCIVNYIVSKTNHLKFWGYNRGGGDELGRTYKLYFKKLSSGIFAFRNIKSTVRLKQFYLIYHGSRNQLSSLMLTPLC